MKKITRLLFFIHVIFFLCILPHLAIAGDPSDTIPATDPDAPIDGGVGLLIAAGIGYGVKRIRDERKKKLNKLP